ITYMLHRFRESFPGIYQVIVEDRNEYMIESLKSFSREHPDEDVAVFVGAAHKKELKSELE
ncbi:MAG: TraB/GumN family protein, partial [Candidatus Nanohalobium sp.]